MDEFKKYFQDHRADLDTDLPGDELWAGVKKTLHPKPAIPLYLKWGAAAACITAIVAATIFFTGNKETGSLAGQQEIKKDPVIDQQKDQPKDQLAIVLPKGDTTEVVNKEGQRLVKRSVRQSTQKINTGRTVNTQNDSATARTNTRRKRNTAKTRYGFEGVEASYASMLNVQLEQIRSQPIYGENAAYFDLFKDRFEDLNKEEAKLKNEFKKADDKVIMLDALILVYQQKISILKQLQFEINKMNSKVKQTDTGVPMQQPSYIHL